MSAPGIHVQCPSCDAQPGEPCRGTGVSGGRLHAGRGGARCQGCRDVVARSTGRGVPWCARCLALPGVLEERGARIADLLLRRTGVDDAERLIADLDRLVRIVERAVPKSRHVDGRRVPAANAGGN